MDKNVEKRLIELNAYVEKQRKLIIGINRAIEKGEFRPTELQELTIDYIRQQGRWGLSEIARLKRYS